MNAEETREIMRETSRVCREYVAWRTEQCKSLAANNGTTIQEEADELHSQWGRVLERTDIESARTVLRRIESGELDVPKYEYGKLPAIIRRESRGYNVPRLQTNPTRFREEPTYRCLPCLDTGIVQVVNPRWVYHHEEQIASGLPDGWHVDAKRWCRENNAGHLFTTVVCNCEHRVAITQRERLAKYLKGELPKDQVPSRRAVFDSRKMAALQSNSPQLIAEQLKAWIENYEPFAGIEWTPDPTEYEQFASS